jgi:hypothetical protein
VISSSFSFAVPRRGTVKRRDKFPHSFLQQEVSLFVR